jgi:hypothetical protein
VFNRGDLDVAANCFAEDCQNHGGKVGRAGVRTVLGEIKTNFREVDYAKLCRGGRVGRCPMQL